ncbi:MAG: DUF6587 family protein [Betaproteobacteria bacterium]
MMQTIAVVVMVTLAAIYSAWKLMPRTWRARGAQALIGWVRRHGRLADDTAADLARRLTASGCGSCESCGACAPKPDERAPGPSVVVRRPGGLRGRPTIRDVDNAGDTRGG